MAETSNALAPNRRSVVSRLRSSAHEVNAWFSAGSSLPDEIWIQRHQWILALLWVHVPAVFAFALIRHQTINHSAAEASIVMAFAAVATLGTYAGQRRFSTVVTSMGLMVSSAVLVHLANGAIEMHFHYFVMVGVVTLYQDWLPFLVAIGFVVVQHGIMGVVDPHSVYSHGAASGSPWHWAAVHGGFILAMSAVGLDVVAAERIAATTCDGTRGEARRGSEGRAGRELGARRPHRRDGVVATSCTGCWTSTRRRALRASTSSVDGCTPTTATRSRPPSTMPRTAGTESALDFRVVTGYGDTLAARPGARRRVADDGRSRWSRAPPRTSPSGSSPKPSCPRPSRS